MHLQNMKHSFLQAWEQALEGMGRFRTVQSFRRARSIQSYTDNTRLWIQEIINIDIDIRETVQRETFIKEELKEMDAGLVLRDENKIAEWKEELKILNYLYIYEAKLRDEIVALCPGGTFERGFQAWRKQPNWHLLAYLRWDCAGRGGCCGRGCGCCEKPRNTTWGGAQQGHCTEQCGCCKRERGKRRLNRAERRHRRPRFNRRSPIDLYARHLEAAYVWGLVKDPNSKMSPKDD